MPRRESDSKSPLEMVGDNHEAHAKRRNPRRSTTAKGFYAEVDGQDEDLMDDEEIPAEDEDEELAHDNEEDDDEDDEEEADEDEDEDEDLPVRKQRTGRRSMRSNKFSSSLKEPSYSINDLTSPEEPPKRKSRKGGNSVSNRRRRRVTTEVHVSDDDEEEDETEDDDFGIGNDGVDQSEENALKIERIIASRKEKRSDWIKICQKINTREITSGSRWFQGNENLTANDADTVEERFLVKWADLSFLHCSWETEMDLDEQIPQAKSYLKTFHRKSYNGCLYTPEERCDGDFFDPAFTQIDRIVELTLPDGTSPPKSYDRAKHIILDKKDPKYDEGTGRHFMIKWMNLSYMYMSYEWERDLIMNEVEYEEELNAYSNRTQKIPKSDLRKKIKIGEENLRRLFKVFGDSSGIADSEREKKAAEYQTELMNHEFPNGGQLRDYQAEGVAWLIANRVNNRSCILADEMGLGKTLQTCTFVDLVANKLGRAGPFLVIAPLSTLTHWEREFKTWTRLNTIVYHGRAKDRELIREHEFAYSDDRPKGGVPANKSFLKKCMGRATSRVDKTWMVHVVLTTPETMTLDDSMQLAAIDWEVLVVDEAHRLKNHSSKLASRLRDERFNFLHTVLLTGTPIQNNMTELWTLLHQVDNQSFSSLEEFLSKYGDMKSKETVDELHSSIRPYILRRLKEDVEKSVPPKEETLIEVELTAVQKTYYRALYEKNVKFLLRDKKKAIHGPSLNNLAMQLRKCCNHPFLLRGVEIEMRGKEAQKEVKTPEGDFMVQFSGKLVLLDKLLPRLRDNGHRVLLFSQFKIMLDILEDYLLARRVKFERVDGSITGKKRQQAIDRFQAAPTQGKELPLVMLLSTRAGGVGINLTAADTCIIYDSDWNPQNDLQAQARCHRIGQTKSVKVYRLLSRKTYEMQMFHMSSLKMGLDQAVLHGVETGGSGEGSMSKEQVEKLLRHGAYDMFNEEKDGTAEAESNAFIEQDIDSIMQGRTTTIIHENTGSKSSVAGGTFSKASFKAAKSQDKNSGNKEDVDVDDPDFWKKMVGEAKMEDPLDSLQSRRRNRTVKNYSERAYERDIDNHLVDSDASVGSLVDHDSSGSDGSESDYSDGPNAVVLLDGASVQDQGVVTKKKIKERSKWGRKGNIGWDKAAADKVVKGLLTYGYGNVTWINFGKSMGLECYDPEEIKRLSWSILFSAFGELAEDSVQAERRRADRAAEKKRRELSGGGVLERVAHTTFDATGKSDQALKKLWNTHRSWSNILIADAKNYISKNRARSASQLDRTLNNRSGNWETKQLRQQRVLFDQHLWPTLRSRGWELERVQSKGSVVTHYKKNDHMYESPCDAMEAAILLHPEMKSAISDVMRVIKSVPNDEAAVLDFSKLSPERIDASTIELLLNHFAPWQLVIDRSSTRKLSFLPKKLIVTCLCLYNAYSMVREAQKSSTSIQSGLQALEKWITHLDLRYPLPHPAWTRRHDAVLIDAIVKHGWVEHDRSCRAIFDDETIKWGSPFDGASGKGAEESTKKDSDLLTAESVERVAKRAGIFLTTEQELVRSTREFRQEFLVNMLHLQFKNGSDTELPLYVVDAERVKSKYSPTAVDAGSAGAGDIPRPETEHPTKKELLKRAKNILGRSLPSPTLMKEKITTSGASPQQPKHKYFVLDQNDPRNSFLSELLRCLAKISFSNSEKRKAMSRKLMAQALLETQERIKESRSKNDETGSVIKLLFENLCEVSANMEKLPAQAKNVLRAILALPLMEPKGGGPLFPTPTGESQSRGNFTEEHEHQGGHSVTKVTRVSDTATIGDKALSKAMTRAKSDLDPKGRFFKDSRQHYLELTPLETLLLTVVCSQGIPVWTDGWVDLLLLSDTVKPANQGTGFQHAISWHGLGFVFESAATVWYESGKEKLEKILDDFHRKHLASGKENPAKEKERTRISVFTQEQRGRKIALAAARNYNTAPVALAKKTTMLLEKLRRWMGTVETKRGSSEAKVKKINRSEFGLGPFVLQWLANEIERWAKSLDVTNLSGKPIGFSAFDYAGEGTGGPSENGETFTKPAALLDKKGCRNIMIQVAQQTRARSIWVKCGSPNIKKKLETAISTCKKNEDRWDDQPSWWESSGHDVCFDRLLLESMLINGFNGIEERINSFIVTPQEPGRVTRSSLQFRANQLTRELHFLVEAEDLVTMLHDRNKSRARREVVEIVDLAMDQVSGTNLTQNKESTEEEGRLDDGEVELLGEEGGGTKRTLTDSVQSLSPEKKPRLDK